jgi:polysaccharide export outer membrane protein
MKEFNIDSSRLQMETEEKTSSMFDLDKIKMVFVLHWKWFIPSVVICLLIATYYLWVTPTTISVTGKMLLIDKNIHFYTINAGAATPFNMGSVNATSSTMGGSAVTSTSSGASQNYLVSNDGTINFPILGRIKVVGLTKDECEDMILEKIRPYMAESERPIVTVRQANYSITVLGEVGSPGTIQVSREKINIYEALAQAGDLTVYGIRDRVKLIRENADGEREIHMLDLSDANIMNSPYFYMQQNDILYVEPSIVKKQQGNIVTSLVIPLTTSLVSFSALLIAIFK